MVVFKDIDQELRNSTKEADSGIAVNEVWRKHGISSATYYKWKAKYGDWMFQSLCECT